MRAASKPQVAPRPQARAPPAPTQAGAAWRGQAKRSDHIESAPGAHRAGPAPPRLVDRARAGRQRGERPAANGAALLLAGALLLLAGGAARATPPRAAPAQPRLSHHVLCEPVSQLDELRLACAHERQFIVVLEAYYSDLYPELVCARANQEARLHELTGSQLVAIFRQLYAPHSAGSSAALARQAGAAERRLLSLAPTLAYGSQRPFCLDDLRAAFQAKCSGRAWCRFRRATDHQWPGCAALKPGHVFARYLCVDEALLVRYCNAHALLASHSRARRHPDPPPDTPLADTPDFGFVASPGYPHFYATPGAAPAPPASQCGWRVEAEPGQRVTVKLLDASLAPHRHARHDPEPPALMPTWPGAQPAGAGPRPANLLVEPADGRAPADGPHRLLFRLDAHDYAKLQAGLAAKLQQVAAQCQGHDQLVLRDPAASPPGHQHDDDARRQLISRLPVTLYRNQLIDFTNQTIYQWLANGSARRIDYQALLDSLDPLQLAWLYQANVTLCASGPQPAQWWAPLADNRISFTSSANVMQLDLIAGRAFNPTNRGLLFWYHKHGCPATRRAPTRARLVLRNDTTEIFHCLEGFVFADTRQSVRVRQCSPEDQVWRDADPAARGARQDQPLASCVYVEEPAVDARPAKFDRLVAAGPGLGAPEVAVEVVGVPAGPAPGPVGADEVDLLAGLAAHQEPAPGRNVSALAGLWRAMLDLVASSNDTASLLTHQPLRELRLSDEPAGSGSVWTRASALFSRRLLAPALAVLFLFVLLNLVIYVIFLVALPKLARLLCGARRRPAADQQGRMANKLAHYESDYSVTMGMSL